MTDTYTIDVTPGKKSRFSKVEIRDIVIAVIVLSVAFAILYRNNSIMTYFEYHLGGSMAWIALFATCLVLVFFSFLLHEFGHKFTAQNYGMRSEFRMSPIGLVITILTSAFGFLFAAPGAVVINGYPDKETNGRIGIAGPAVNIVLSAIGIIGCLLTNGSVAVAFFAMFASLNAFLAFFNMLPIPPLDGSKIWKWNPVLYVVVFAIAIVEVAYVYLGMTDLYFYL